MKTLVIPIIIVLSTVLNINTFAQTENTNTTGIQKSIKFDLLGLADKEVAFEFEQPLGKGNSYNFRTGFKFYSNTPDLEIGKTTNNYTVTYRSRSSWFLFIPSSNQSTYYSEKTQPMTDYGSFVPTFSIPLNNSFRRYLNPNQNSKFYFEGGLLASINKGYNIKTEIKRTLVDENDYGYGSNIILSHRSSSNTFEVDELRNINKGFNITSGLSLGMGLNSYVGKNYLIDLKGEIGTNFINGSSNYRNYTVGKAYAKVKLLIGFRL